MSSVDLAALKRLVGSLSRIEHFGVAEEAAIVEAERDLGFDIPVVLKRVYREIGNGGFGPGNGGTIVGVRGGYESNFCDLVSTYREFVEASQTIGWTWRVGMLPFCEWGCNIFTCVDCIDPGSRIWVSRELQIEPQGYSIDEFFNYWMEGRALLK